MGIIVEKKQELDKKVLDLMQTVKDRRSKIGSLKKPQWKTSCSLVLPGYERLNIQICSDLSLLASTCGTLIRMKQDIEVASKELDVKIDPQWQQYPITDWVDDIKLRVKVTQLKIEQDKLARLEAKLRELTSEDQRREMEIADIEDALKG